jgi:nickel-dependent lactate racemase
MAQTYPAQMGGAVFAYDPDTRQLASLDHRGGGHQDGLASSDRNTDPGEHAAAQASFWILDQSFDVVVTTNSGYPLDQNLYQAVKGMRAAESIVKDRGVIICAAECREGLPEHGSYSDLLRSRPDPHALLEMIDDPEFAMPDQWQVQVQALVQSRARVYLKSAGIGRDELAGAHLEPADDVAEVARRSIAEAGPGARLCVLPQGPLTIPYLSSAANSMSP